MTFQARPARYEIPMRCCVVDDKTHKKMMCQNITGRGTTKNAARNHNKLIFNAKANAEIIYRKENNIPSNKEVSVQVIGRTRLEYIQEKDTITKRERWVNRRTGKGRYLSVTRDRKGRFVRSGAWSSTPAEEQLDEQLAEGLDYDFEFSEDTEDQ